MKTLRDGGLAIGTLGPMSVPPIPAGHSTVIPHLNVTDAKAAIEFYRAAFGAVPGNMSVMEDGKVLHAEIRIGNSVVFLNDHFGPPAPPPSGVTIHIWTEQIDELWEQAVNAGARVKMPLADQFWGDRYGHLQDPYGHLWSLGKHIEDVSPEHMAKRAAEAFKAFETE